MGVDLDATRRLDFRQLSESPEARASFCLDFVQGLRDRGYVFVDEHPLSGEVIRQLFSESHDFFALPATAKQHAAHPVAASPHRGWSAIGRENISGITGFMEGIENPARQVDVKESFDQGREFDVEFPNRWPLPADAPQFRRIMVDFFDAAHATLQLLFGALADGLGMPTSTFVDQHHGQHHELRLLRYPPIQRHVLERHDTVRISSHTDFGSMTLLFQDEVGGLEAESLRDPGHFSPVCCSQDTMIVLLGDSMQRMTNGYLRAPPHRVQGPQRASGHDEPESTVPERFSAAFFGKPDRDVSIAPMPMFVSPTTPAQYPAMTMGEYGMIKLLKTY